MANNKRIARNTLFLYIRLLITTMVGLYTSRVVLQKLGVEDLGIYGVVGSIVTVFSTLNSTMSISTYRFLNIAIGKGDKTYLSDVFRTSLLIHILIACIFVIVSESIGPWLIGSKLVIPENRLYAAQWAFQFSLITCVFMVISAPYSCSIMAHEKMDVYAYFTIFDTSMKLLIVYLIGHSPFDKLIEYSFYLCCLQVVLRFLYNLYSKRVFEEIGFSIRVKKDLMIKMLKFTSWNILHCIANIFYTEGLNIILNIFCGPVVNAARLMAVQVQSKVMVFGRNLQEAFNPQIMKNYASGNFDYMCKLVVSSSKFSFFLLILFILPLIIETKFVLNLWLGTPPQYTTTFVRLILITILIDALQNSLLTSVYSTGKIKWYSIIMSFILLLVIPNSYFVLQRGAPPYVAFIIQIIFMFIGLCISLCFARKYIGLKFSFYFSNTIFPISMILILSIPIPIILKFFIGNSIINSLFIIFVTATITLLSIYLVGLASAERDYLIKYIKKLNMNKTIDLQLHKIRELYEWKYKRYFDRHPEHLTRECNPDKVSKMIFELLDSPRPCMIARYGMTEFNALANYICTKKGPHNLLNFFLCKTHAWWLSPFRMENLGNYSGVFPYTTALYEKFCKLLLEDTKELDILASWIDDEIYLEKELLNVKKIFLPYLEPYHSSEPWSRILKNKKVLVVHPFSEQIKSQYETKRQKLFKDKTVLPLFTLDVIQAVQSLGGNNNGFKDWFEALEWMKHEIDKKDYDICIIGCGAYGFHLAAHVKRMGKQAIHMGGATQLLFGIKGNRWENPNYGVKEWGLPYGFYTNLMNENWIKPGEKGRPHNADKVEGACYW